MITTMSRLVRFHIDAKIIPYTLDGAMCAQAFLVLINYTIHVLQLFITTFLTV